MTTLSIGATITSKVIKIKSCLEHLFSMFSFCVLHPPSYKHEASKHVASHFRHYEKLVTKILFYFSRKKKNKTGDQLNENLGWET